MKLNICLAGATGWVGAPLSKAIAGASDMKLVGAVSRTHAGKRLGDVVGDPSLDVTISGTVDEALGSATDILVDYTKPDVVKSNVLTAVRRGVHVVIGTSGLSKNDYDEIHSAATRQKVGVIAVGNFAITSVLMNRFACEAAKHLSHWEIIDYAHEDKIDAPSGMALELAHRLSEIREPKTARPVGETYGVKESRGATLCGTQVHSIRQPSYTVALEIIFGVEDERLTIRYDAGAGPTPYLKGTLLAVRNVRKQIGLTRGLNHIALTE